MKNGSRWVPAATARERLYWSYASYMSYRPCLADARCKDTEPLPTMNDGRRSKKARVWSTNMPRAWNARFGLFTFYF